MGEIRQDLVSGSWVIMAPERAKRPHAFLEKKKKRVRVSKTECPFEHIEESGSWPPLGSAPDLRSWRSVIIPNKYPALPHRDLCAEPIGEGPYTALTAVGSHELLITKDHDKNISEISFPEALEAFELLQKRYRMLAKDRCLVYTSTFFNWGPTAGATVYHPHYQILTLPIIPPHVQHSLTTSSAYFDEHGRCVHCSVVAYELRMKRRIIVESRGAVAIAPFAAREPFEVRIYPRRHESFFEDTSLKSLREVVKTLQETMRKVKRYLGDPDINFFIHTSPFKNKKNHNHYHWHIELLPRLSIGAGFEEGTGVRINVVDPDIAARVLRGGSFVAAPKKRRAK